MQILRACNSDIDGVNRLLEQVLMVHHNGRPDLFKANVKKYTDEELYSIFADEERPVFVMKDEKGDVAGYAFCVIIKQRGNNILQDMTTLYIDDLCVDETLRGQKIGSRLYEYVLDYAKQIGCYNVTLNVWACNESAKKFYEKCGLKPQKIGMETILS